MMASSNSAEQPLILYNTLRLKREKKKLHYFERIEKGERAKQEKAKRVAGFQNNFQKKNQAKRKGPSWKLCWVLEGKKSGRTKTSLGKDGPGLGSECVA